MTMVNALNVPHTSTPPAATFVPAPLAHGPHPATVAAPAGRWLVSVGSASFRCRPHICHPSERRPDPLARRVSASADVRSSA
eukprot:COSAG06_NODE_4994_length_3802_cov_5.156360_3_plen_82_part_00